MDKVDAAMESPQTVDQYISQAPIQVQSLLADIRATVRAVAPLAEERISYGMPAYFLDGALVYFGAFKKHIGFFPPVRDEALKPLLTRYAGPKGNLQFPLAEPMPHALIAQIVQARIAENQARKASKAAT